jgi:predicted membrane-bound mannosyltransferase
MLIYSRTSTGPLWSEGVIIVLAIAGYIAAFSKIKFADELIDKNLLRFLAFYTLILTVIYSAIPYKTPWCLLGFLHGMILMAAVGAAVIIERLPVVPGRVFFILLVISGGWLTFQAYQGSYRYYDDHANPYVYAHTSRDVFAMVDRIEEIAKADKAGHDMYIQVIASDDDYWPLPWYLRSFSRVSWQNRIDNDLPSAPVIIASADMEPELIKKLYQQPPPGQRSLYIPLFDRYMQLRPTVELRGYVKKSLWDDYQRIKND